MALSSREGHLHDLSVEGEHGPVVAGPTVGSMNDTKLFVGQIPKDMEEAYLFPFLTSFGTVVDLSIIRDKTDLSHQGCAFVTYKFAASATMAIEQLHDKVRLPNSANPLQVRLAEAIVEKEHKLFIGMLPRSHTEKHLHDMFAPFGEIREIHIIRGPDGSSKGCAFVKFTERVAAIVAIEFFNDYILPGTTRPCVVKFAVGKKPSKQEMADIQSATSAAAAADAIAIAAATDISVQEQNEFQHHGGQTLELPIQEMQSATLNQHKLQTAHIQFTIPSAPQQLSQGDVKNSGLQSQNQLDPKPTLDTYSSVGSAGVVAPVAVNNSTASTSVPAPVNVPSSYETTVMYASSHSPHVSRPPSGPMPYPPTAGVLRSGQHDALGWNQIQIRPQFVNYQSNQLARAALPPYTGGNGGRMAGGNSSTGDRFGIESYYDSMHEIREANRLSSSNTKPPEGPARANLFIYHLPRDITDADLATLFSPFGNIISAKVFIDKKTMDSKGFGFVSYDHASSAQLAITSMNGFQIGSKRLKVQHKRLEGVQHSHPFFAGHGHGDARGIPGYPPQHTSQQS